MRGHPRRPPQNHVSFKEQKITGNAGTDLANTNLIDSLFGTGRNYSKQLFYGYIDNIPVSKTLKYKQYIRIHKNKIIDTQ